MSPALYRHVRCPIMLHGDTGSGVYQYQLTGICATNMGWDRFHAELDAVHLAVKQFWWLKL
jgi:hypothetical protein